MGKDMDSWKFFIMTFGCKVNQYESQQIRETWVEQGGVETSIPQEAQYILINSCAITGKAEHDARNALNRLKSLAPSAKMVFTGCAAQFLPEYKPRKDTSLASPDWCIPQAEKLSQCANLILDDKLSDNKIAIYPALHTYYRSRPVLKIQDGCSRRCTYCIVPQTRGNPHSKAESDVLKEFQGLAQAGYGEIILSGINLGQYKGDFWSLIKSIDELISREFPSAVRFRISSLDPSMLTPPALTTLSECRHLCPHLHLSLQHASERILTKMGRSGCRVESLYDALKYIKSAWPIMGIGADFIIGFPGEKEEDVELLLDFVQAFPLTYAHVFPYSKRPGTPASTMEEQVPLKEKLKRAAKVRDKIALKNKDFLKSQLGLPEVVVALERRASGKFGGVNEYYTNCIILGDCTEKKGLLSARPVGTHDKNLLVQPLETRN